MKNWILIPMLALGFAACKSAPTKSSREVASGGGPIAEMIYKTAQSTGKSEDDIARMYASTLKKEGRITGNTPINSVADLENYFGKSAAREDAIKVLRANADVFAQKLKVNSDVLTRSFDEAAEASGRYGDTAVNENAFSGMALVKPKNSSAAAELDEAIKSARTTDRAIASDIGVKNTINQCDELSPEAVRNVDGIAQKAHNRLKQDTDYASLSTSEKQKRFKKYREEEYEATTGQPKRNICHAYGKVPKGEKVAGVKPGCPVPVYVEVGGASVMCE